MQHTLKCSLLHRRPRALLNSTSARTAWCNTVSRVNTVFPFLKLTLRIQVFTDWIPSLYPERVGAIHRQRFFEMVHTDSMACAIFLTYGFGRAAFEQLAGSETNDRENALSRYWLKYKATCLRMKGEILATLWPVFAAKPLYFASISLAGCAFIVNNPNEGRMHLRGAVNIANTLGGFNVLDELELEASLLWDVQIASLTGEKPVIEDAEISPIAEKLLPQLPGWLERSRQRFDLLLRSSLSITCTHRGQSDVCHALQRLFEATELINSFSTRSEEDKINATLVTRTLFAGYKLCLCAPADADRENLGPAHDHDHDHDIDLLESLRLAGLLVINTTHLKATRKAHLFEKLSKDLHVRLRRQDLGTLWKQCPELILWVCFV